MRKRYSDWNGKPVYFDGFNGQTYIGRIDKVYRGVAILRYSVPGHGETVSYLDLNRYEHRLTLKVSSISTGVL